MNPTDAPPATQSAKTPARSTTVARTLLGSASSSWMTTAVTPVPTLFGGNVKLYSRVRLQGADDGEEIAHLRIARWPEHAHQALWRDLHFFRQLFEANRRVYVVAQHVLCDSLLSGKQSIDPFAQKRHRDLW